MSLYTPPSTIRRLIMEAENLTLSPDAGAQEAQQFAATPNDVMSDLSTATSQGAPQPPGLQGSALTMPNIAPPAPTVEKTVINRDIILSQLAELKSIITNYEKKFDGDDLTPEDANVYISSLLSSLVFHAERLNAFMSSDGGESSEGLPEMPEEMPTPEEAGPEAPPPVEEPVSPEAAGPEAPPEAGMPPPGPEAPPPVEQPQV